MGLAAYRRFALWVLLVAPLPWVPAIAAAQPYPLPGKQIHLIVAFPAGGQTDLQARLIAPKLSAALGIPVIVQNKPGGSSIIGVHHVARANPDGYTLLYTIASPIVVNPHVFANLPYNALHDLAPVCLTATTAQVLVAHSSVPAMGMKELIAYAKSKPGQLNFGSYGVGSSSHLYGQMLQSSAGISLTHVPYKGASDVIKDLIVGRIQLAFMALTAAQAHVQSGSLKILGAVGGQRQPSLPNVPTLAEQGVAGLEQTGWLGIFAPVNTPTPVVERLSFEIGKILQMPEIVERFRYGGAEAMGTSPAVFKRLVHDDYARWGEVVRQKGLGLD
jgi:tripartite-type tricarboxylate transporter receptor subunit TctC